MIIQTKALVLKSLKYNETSLIVHCYTETLGKQSFLLKGILKARKGSLRVAQFQALSQLEIQFHYKKKAGLQFLKEVKVTYPYLSIYQQIEKNAQVFFLSEILSNSIGEEEANPALFRFLETAFQWLDSSDKTANFHLFFLIKLTQYLGFYPNLESDHLRYFDLKNGCYSAAPSEDFMHGKTLELLKIFLGTTFAQIDLPKINQTQRREMLNALVRYYELHLQGFSKPKSLSILNEIFN